MKKTSSVVTGGATFAAAGISPLVEWVANNKFGLAMPPQVVLIVAAALVPIAHFLVNLAKPTTSFAPTVVTREAGFARVGALLACALVALAGCSLISPTVDKIEAGAAQTVVQSAERTICRDLPIGAWMSNYGTNAERIKGWQALCFNPINAPLDKETVAAILKIYPSFQQAAPAPATPDPTPTPTPTPTPVPAVIPPPAAHTRVRRAPRLIPVPEQHPTPATAPAPVLVPPTPTPISLLTARGSLLTAP